MVRIVRTGKVIQKIAKGGRVLSGSSFRTLEDAKRLEKQYKHDMKLGLNVEVGTKREVYASESSKKAVKRYRQELKRKGK